MKLKKCNKLRRLARFIFLQKKLVGKENNFVRQAS